MGCIIKYKGRSYTEEEFKEVVKKNFAQFVTNSKAKVYVTSEGTLSLASVDKDGVANKPYLRDETQGETIKRKRVQPGGVFISGSFISKFIPNYRSMSNEELFGTYDENGVMTNPGVIDNRILTNLIGYRIPNQGAASNDALQIVGILPEENGDTIVAYTGITTKTGSDYDIDKMYVMMPYFGFSHNKAARFQLTRKLVDLISNNRGSIKKSLFTIKETFKDLIDEGLDFDFQDYTEKLVEIASYSAEYREIESQIRSSDVENAELTEKTVELSRILQKLRVDTHLMTTSILDEIVTGDLATTRAAREFIEKFNIKLGQLRYVTNQNTRNGQANRLIELYKGILTSPELMSTIMRPIDYSFLKQGINKITASMKSDTNAPLYHFDPLVDIDTMYDYSNGKAGIGQVANAMVDISRPGKITINNLEGFEFANKEGNTVILDREFSKPLSDSELDKYIKFLGLTTQEEIDALKSELVGVKTIESMVAIFNGFVDINKNPFSIQSNWVPSTIHLGITLLRMGVNPIYVLLLIAQPATSVIATAYKKHRFNNGFNKKENIVLQLLREKSKDKKYITALDILYRNPVPLVARSTRNLNIGKKFITSKETGVEHKVYEAELVENIKEFSKLDYETQALYCIYNDLDFKNESSRIKEMVGKLLEVVEQIEEDADITKYDIIKSFISEYMIGEEMFAGERKKFNSMFYNNHKALRSGSAFGVVTQSALAGYMAFNPSSNSKVLIAAINNKQVTTAGTYLELHRNFKSKNTKLLPVLSQVLDDVNQAIANESPIEVTDIEQNGIVKMTSQLEGEMDFNYQLSVYEMFIRLKGISNQLRDNIVLSRQDIEGPGKSISKMFLFNNAMKRLTNTDSSSADVLIGVENKFKNTPLGVRNRNLNDIFSKLTNNSELFMELTPRNLFIANYISHQLEGKDIENEELFDEIKNASYTTMMAEFFGVNEDNVVDILTNVPIKFKELKDTTSGNYEILNILGVMNNPTGNIPMTIFKNSGEISNLQEDAIINSWNEMFKSRRPEIVELANDLVKYAFASSGLKMNKNQFYTLIPNNYYIDNNIEGFVRNYNTDASFAHRFIRKHQLTYDKGFKRVPVDEIVCKNGPIYTLHPLKPFRGNYVKIEGRNFFYAYDKPEGRVYLPLTQMSVSLGGKELPVYMDTKNSINFDYADNLSVEEKDEIIELIKTNPLLANELNDEYANNSDYILNLPKTMQVKERTNIPKTASVTVKDTLFENQEAIINSLGVDTYYEMMNNSSLSELTPEELDEYIKNCL